MKKILYLVTCCLASYVVAEDGISIENTTTENDRTNIGITSMTDAQKSAFELWLGSWTKRVIQAAPTYHPTLSLNQWVNGWPTYVQVNPPQDSTKSDQETNDKATIFRNIDGERLILNNGSEWEISSSDHFNTRYWTRGTPLQIKESKSEDLNRPYSITNQNTGELVGAKKTKGPTSTPKDSPSYFRGTFQLHGMSPTGDEVRLMNNSIWKIAPVDQQKIITTWKPHDRIRVKESGDAMWPYTLNNLDSGSTAIAIKKD